MPGLTDDLAIEGWRLSNWQIRKAKLWLRLNTPARLILYEQLATHIGTGQTLSDSLVAIWENQTDDGRSPAGALPQAICRWLHDIRDSGYSFGMAVNGWLPEVEAQMVAVIFESTPSSTALRQLATRARSFRGSALGIGAASLQALMILIGIGWLFIALGNAITELLANSAQSITGTSIIIIQLLSGFARTLGPAILISLIGFVVVFFISAPRWRGRWRELADRIFPFSLYSTWSASLFFSSMASYLSAGAEEHVALRTLAARAQPYLQERLTAVARFDGLPLGDALLAAGYAWPPITLLRQARHILNNPDESYALKLDQLAVEAQNSVHAAILRMAEMVKWFMSIMIALILFLMLMISHDLMTSLNIGQ